MPEGIAENGLRSFKAGWTKGQRKHVASPKNLDLHDSLRYASTRVSFDGAHPIATRSSTSFFLSDWIEASAPVSRMFGAQLNARTKILRTSSPAKHTRLHTSSFIRPKEIQSMLRHSRLATTHRRYMQEIPRVKVTVEAINQELRLRPKQVETAEASSNFRPISGRARRAGPAK